VMTIPEKVRDLMLSKKLTIDEKRERLRALIPDEALKINNLNQATPAQLKRPKEAIEIAETLQQLERADFCRDHHQRDDGSI
jgi:hypothetical protein